MPSPKKQERKSLGRRCPRRFRAKQLRRLQPGQGDARSQALQYDYVRARCRRFAGDRSKSFDDGVPVGWIGPGSNERRLPPPTSKHKLRTAARAMASNVNSSSGTRHQKISPALIAKLWTTDDQFKQHGKPILVFLQRLFHFHQQRLIRQVHRSAQCIAKKLAAQGSDKILAPVLVNILDQSRNSCSQLPVWQFGHVVNRPPGAIRRPRLGRSDQTPPSPIPGRQNACDTWHTGHPRRGPPAVRESSLVAPFSLPAISEHRPVAAENAGPASDARSRIRVSPDSFVRLPSSWSRITAMPNRPPRPGSPASPCTGYQFWSPVFRTAFLILPFEVATVVLREGAIHERHVAVQQIGDRPIRLNQMRCQSHRFLKDRLAQFVV